MWAVWWLLPRAFSVVALLAFHKAAVPLVDHFPIPLCSSCPLW